MKKLFLRFAIAILVILAAHSLAFANNLSITNVVLQDRNATSKTAVIQFDISWDNSWKDTTNHDAVWVILKAQTIAGGVAGATVHGRLSGALTAATVDSSDTSPGSNTDLEIYIPADHLGAFIRRKLPGTGTVQSSSVRLTFDYNDSRSGGSSYGQFADGAAIQVKVIGMEMVFIPTADFRVGDASALSVSNNKGVLRQGSTDTDSWYINSELAITTSIANNTYFYTTQSQTYEALSGGIFTIPAAFPKGYAAFYCMKYEITEGLWVDFINTLLAEQQSTRDITALPGTVLGKNSDTVIYRNTIAFSGNATTARGTATTIRPNRPVSYLSWMDLCAFLDWAALRPMTELEYEKICRGPLAPVAGEYAWGSAAVTPAASISGSAELGVETIATANANVAASNTTFTGGDTFINGSVNNSQGPLRAGIFATSASTRVTSGAGYYGVMEMTGNLWERVITIGNSGGLVFTGAHGDGILTSGLGGVMNDGNANAANWPHLDLQNTARGVTRADGSGFRGGSWADTLTTSMWMSDRERAAKTTDYTRTQYYGGRGVRTYDGP